MHAISIKHRNTIQAKLLKCILQGHKECIVAIDKS